jgi:uncharacterized protein YqiB (DUF1249 family)
MRTKRVYLNLMPLYEDNYRRLMHLVPELGGAQTVSARLLERDETGAALEVSIIDRGPYTTTVTLVHALMPQHGAIPRLSLTVRAYHDARLAEVIGYQNQSRFNPYYDYPNRQMRQRFEKRQVNLFLREWLAYFRAGEHVLEGVTDYGRA